MTGQAGPVPRASGQTARLPPPDAAADSVPKLPPVPTGPEPGQIMFLPLPASVYVFFLHSWEAVNSSDGPGGHLRKVGRKQRVQRDLKIIGEDEEVQVEGQGA